MSQSSRTTDVLIVGAGPVGLTLANLLTNLGVTCRIITKEAHLRPVAESRAEGVHIRTQHLLEQLGVLDQAFSQGRPAHGVTLHAKKQVLGSFPLDDPENPCFPGAVILEQGKVEHILAERLTRQGVVLERGMELVGLQQEPDRVVSTLKLADGQEVQAIARYVVGCDGAHSQVRHAIGATFTGQGHPGKYALADVEIDWRDQPYDDNLHVFLSPMVVMGRLAEGSWKVAGMLHTSIDPTQRTEEELVLTALQQQMDGNSIPAKLHSPRWTSLFRISTRMVEQMRDRRVFLAGDAAHIHSPMGGQGMNEGMQDALNLAWKLALVLQGQAEENILDTYQIERHPVIAEVLRDTQWMTQLIEMQNPIATYIRNTTLASVTGLESVQTAMRLQFSGSQRPLGASKLLSEHRPSLSERLRRVSQRKLYPHSVNSFQFAEAKVGHRAPDGAGIVSVENGAEQRLFQVWAKEAQPFFHRLLFFVGQSADVKRLREINQRAQSMANQWGNLLRTYLICLSGVSGQRNTMEPGPTLLEDRLGELHHRYGANVECLYLVRPDGFIGFRSLSLDPQPLQVFLMQMFRETQTDN